MCVLLAITINRHACWKDRGANDWCRECINSPLVSFFCFFAANYYRISKEIFNISLLYKFISMLQLEGQETTVFPCNFCGVLFWGGGGVQVEEYLAKVVQLFSYLTDKDLFAEIYRNQLAKRLLNQRSASDDMERLMIGGPENEKHFVSGIAPPISFLFCFFFPVGGFSFFFLLLR